MSWKHQRRRPESQRETRLSWIHGKLMNDGVVVSPREASSGASGSRCAVISKPTTKRGLFNSIKSIKESTSTSFFLGFERYCTIDTSQSQRKENSRVHTISHHITQCPHTTHDKNGISPKTIHRSIHGHGHDHGQSRTTYPRRTTDHRGQERGVSRCIALLNRLPYVSCSRMRCGSFLERGWDPRKGTCHSDTGATSSSSRISYSRPHPFLICCHDDY
mmetsp:Transcript_44261/g.49367  ORF Transcript_44261/g.49367 Transcript_44261/m.49367 type:complete len:218 (-) Transcript_44261:198-851(-)